MIDSFFTVSDVYTTHYTHSSYRITFYRACLKCIVKNAHILSNVFLNSKAYVKLKTVGNLSMDVFETRTATGRQMQLLLVRSSHNQLVGN